MPFRVVSLPREDEQEAEPEDVLVAQPFPLDFGVGEDADHVVRGLDAPALQRLGVVPEHLHRAHIPGDPRGILGAAKFFRHVGLVLGVSGAKHFVGQPEHGRPVLFRHAKHLADDCERDVAGDIDNEVALALLCDLVEERIRRFADLRLPECDRAGGERLVHEPPHFHVPRRVHRDEHFAVAGGGCRRILFVHCLESDDAALRGKNLGVA
ncbi:hypothetical protein [Candidatus Amarobacter glycogenicus]|uniref:hypothetical protein n=1 Tax=Candidatus Amarobacter glycogenicus TaxID=3140699 RepID=UPI003134C3AD|nr:hypothetical protein [Dehalococcoidia bacterium]